MTSNRDAFETAKKIFPGGVNSPVRAFKSVGSEPPFIAKGKGSKITDIEGKTYIDYVGSWGPLILGHADEEVVEAISKVAALGTSFGAPTTRESDLGVLIREAFPSMQLMRLLSSGTEATMSAIRLARGYTNRPYIVKFDGCYHGHGDSLLVNAGSGVATLGIPGCPGINEGTASATLIVPYNDIEALKKTFAAHKGKIAAVIIEPVCGNIGVVNPHKGYLAAIRDLTKAEGALYIFDEVMTGFRGTYGGVQTLEKITPDLTCLGKIVGGGMPLAAYGGKEEIMRHIAPDGPVYQAGTLSGNPVAVAAGTVTLNRLKKTADFYPTLIKKTEKLCQGLQEVFKKHQVSSQLNRFGSMFTGFFTGTPVVDYTTAKTSDTKKFGEWFRGMLQEGIYLAPSQFEAAFMSYVHSDADIDATLKAADRVLGKIK